VRLSWTVRLTFYQRSGSVMAFKNGSWGEVWWGKERRVYRYKCKRGRHSRGYLGQGSSLFVLEHRRLQFYSVSDSNARLSLRSNATDLQLQIHCRSIPCRPLYTVSLGGPRSRLTEELLKCYGCMATGREVSIHFTSLHIF
jgi:hypothetical protein